MAWYDKRFGAGEFLFLLRLPAVFLFTQGAVRFTFARNEGGLFGGERT